MRFQMQVHQLEIDLPDSAITTSDSQPLCDAFVEKYELTYGKNSTYLDAGIEMVAFRVIGTLALERPTLTHAVGATSGTSQTGERGVLFDARDGFVATAIHDGSRLTPGQRLDGPAIIQRFGDTVVVPPDTRINVDRFGGLTISTGTKQ